MIAEPLGMIIEPFDPDVKVKGKGKGSAFI